MSVSKAKMRAARSAAVLAQAGTALLMTACDQPPPEFYPPNLTEAPVEQPAQWQPCAWDPEAHDRLAECAFVSVPLAHDLDSGKRTRLLVKRRLATGNSRKQIWLVHGGPGASATAGMKDLAFDIPDMRDDIDFFAVDHRGTGGSERLGCPQEEAEDSPGGTLVEDDEWPACIAAVSAAKGEQLAHFTTADAARDLAILVDKFRRPSVPVFVYGGSYGTYLVRRYLALAPKQPDGVILEGMVAADGGMSGYDARLEAGASRLLDACDNAPACARHFGAPLRMETNRMLDELANGHCRILNLTPRTARQLLAAMTFYNDTRVLVPPLVHRIRRCDWRDVWFVVRLAMKFSKATRNKSYSQVLHYHVVLSEMYRPALSLGALRDQFENATLSTGMELAYAQLYPKWPRYAPSVPAKQGLYAGPILVLQGGLDAASPVGQAERAAMAIRQQRLHLIVFPEGAHGVTGATPTVDGTDCARQIYLGFIDRQNVAPNSECVSDIQPLDWRTIPANATRLAGTDDLWGE